jgi:hypothetical protein
LQSPSKSTRIFDPFFLTMAAFALTAFALVALDDPAPRPQHRRLECPKGFQPMQRLELLFGLSRKGRPPVAEEEWQAFVDAEVTPRFPDGLTVLAGDGQWLNAEGALVKEPARVLLVLIKPATDAEARIEGLRAAWKTRHSQESVMRLDGASCVSF